jgi:hypothetical protein
MKQYQLHVEFHTVGVRVKAKNLREAKRKVMRRLSRRKASGLVNHNHTYVDELP